MEIYKQNIGRSLEEIMYGVGAQDYIAAVHVGLSQHCSLWAVVI